MKGSRVDCLMGDGQKSCSGAYDGRGGGFVAAAMLSFLFVCQAQAATYYVDKATGSDARAGTSTSTAWATIGKANATLRAGDTVYIRAGTYYEIIEPYQSGSAGAPITYQNYPGETVVVRGESGKANIVALGISYRSPVGPRSYIIVDGFTLRHVDPKSVTSRPVHVYVTNSNSRYNIVRNCTIQAQGVATFSGGREDGVWVVGGAKHTLIENNHISGWPRIGVIVGEVAQYTTIRGNRIVNCTRSNINIGSSYGTMQYTLIENNFIDGSLLEDGIQFEANYSLPSGTIDRDSNRGTVIRNNVIRYSAENNIDLKAAAYIVIEGNILYGATHNDDGGLNPNYGDNRFPGAWSIMHGSSTGSSNVIIRRNVLYDGPGGILPENYYKIYNNTIVYNNRDYTGSNSSWQNTEKPSFIGISAWNGKTGVAIKNNIIGGHNSADVAMGRNATALEINHNLYFNDNGALLVDYRGRYDWSLVSFSQWPALLASLGVKGADSKSLQAGPLFVNVPADPTGSHETFDFRLRSTSPAIDRGGFLTTTTSAGQGTSIPVADAGYFFDGWGIVGGDVIQLQGQSATARIVSISSNTLVVDKTMSWSSGQGVALSYNGSAPDIGAYEYGTNSTTYTLTVSATNGTVTRNPNKTSYTSGEKVTLEAVPATGYTFSGWSGDLTGTTNPATLVMDSNKSVTASFIALAAGEKAVGNTPVFPSINQDANRRAVPYTMPEAGQLQSVSIYHEAGSGQMLLAVYADSSGLPGTRLGVTNATTVNSTAGWQTVALQSPVSVAAGQTIWLAWVFQTNPGIRAMAGTPGRAHSSDTWTAGMPSSFGTATVSDWIYSIYATYTPASAASYTLTVSATNGTVTKNPNKTSYTAGETVTLEAVPATGYTFSGWSGALTGTTNPATLVMDSNKSVTANFTAITYTLSVSATNGTVTRNPNKSSYTAGETVTLEAVPATGYTFSGWSGDLTGTTNPTTLVMDSNKSVTANFIALATGEKAVGNTTVFTESINQDANRRAAPYTMPEAGQLQSVSIYHEAGSGQMLLAVYADSSGLPGTQLGVTNATTVSSTAGWQTVALQSPVSVSAGQKIWLAWVFQTNPGIRAMAGAPGRAHSGDTWTAGMPSNFGTATASNWIYSIYATYTPVSAASYTLTVSASNGTVTKSPNKTGYTAGETVSLQAVPATGYTFSGWSGALTGTTNPATLVMDSNKSVTANFTAITYTLSVSATNGTVTKNPDKTSYTSGETVTLEAVPATGYTFSGWSGALTGTTNPATLVMDSNKSVTANFTAMTYTLSVSASNGTVAKTPDKTSYSSGETVSLQAVPSTGYTFAGWSGDLTGTTNPATLVMNASKAVAASFVKASVDQTPPTVGHCAPAPDSIQAPPNTLVVLRVMDEGEGVDAASVSIRVNGALVYTGDVSSLGTEYGVCHRSGTKADYTYSFQPYESLGHDRRIEVAVQARDLAGNAMADPTRSGAAGHTYAFVTEMYAFGANLRVTADQATLAQGRPATVSDVQGNLWVVWQAGTPGSRHVYAARYRPELDAYNSSVRVSQSAGDHCNPVVAIDGTGILYAVWQENAGGKWDLYVSTSLDGKVWSAPKPVVPTTNGPAGNRTHPVLAAAGNLVAVAWQEDRAGNQDLWVARTTNRFQTVAVSQVTTDTADQTGPALAIDSQGTVYLLWTDARNGATDLYGAASDQGPWTNVPVVRAAGNQFQPALAAGSTGRRLHLAWVDDAAGNLEVFYATSDALPVNPLTGTSIIDDTSGADQQTPTLAVAAGANGADRVYVCWKDGRNLAYSGNADLYFAEVTSGALRTNVLVCDDGIGVDPHDVALGIDAWGYPYVLWADQATGLLQIYYTGVTYPCPVPLADRQIVAAVGGVVGTPPEKITALDDVSVVIPAQGCPFDARISIARIYNPQGFATESLRHYEFGPSGLRFTQPVTITIPYSTRANGTIKAYWFDAVTGAFSDEGVTDVQDINVKGNLRALRFKTTHFTPFYLLPAQGSDAASGGKMRAPALPTEFSLDALLSRFRELRTRLIQRTDVQ